MLAGLSHPNVVRFYGVCTDLTSRTTGRLQVRASDSPRHAFLRHLFREPGS